MGSKSEDMVSITLVPFYKILEQSIFQLEIESWRDKRRSVSHCGLRWDFHGAPVEISWNPGRRRRVCLSLEKAGGLLFPVTNCSLGVYNSEARRKWHSTLLFHGGCKIAKSAIESSQGDSFRQRMCIRRDAAQVADTGRRIVVFSTYWKQKTRPGGALSSGDNLISRDWVETSKLYSLCCTWQFVSWLTMTEPATNLPSRETPQKIDFPGSVFCLENMCLWFWRKFYLKSVINLLFIYFWLEI